jgi:hypothetical protein
VLAEDLLMIRVIHRCTVKEGDEAEFVSSTPNIDAIQWRVAKLFEAPKEED